MIPIQEAKGGGTSSQSDLLVTPPLLPNAYFVRFSNRGSLNYILDQSKNTTNRKTHALV